MPDQKNYAPKLSYIDILLDAPRRPYKKIMDYPVSVISDLGDFYRTPTFKGHDHIVMNADAVEHILKTNRDNYTKVNEIYRRGEVVIGKCLLTTAGEAWACKRKAMQPAFHADYSRRYADIMANTTAEFFDAWMPLAEKKKVVQLSAEMLRLGFFISTRTLFSMSFDESADNLIKDAYFLQDYAFGWRTVFHMKKNLKYLWTMRKMNKYCKKVIYKHESMPMGDVVDLLLKAREEPGCGWQSFNGLQDEVRMLLITGYETVGTNLSWLFFILSLRPEFWAPLQAEVDSVLGQRMPTFDDLPNLPFCKMVISESMRLFPSIMATNRLALEDDVVCGYDVPKGSSLMIHFYGLHRNPNYWPEAEIFDPERFSEENKKLQKKFSYAPFGAGPRACIASNYAMIEVTIIVAMFIQRFTLVNKSKKAIEPFPGITIRPSPNIRSQLVLREGIV